MSRYVTVCAEQDVAPGSLHVVEVEGLRLCVARCEDGTYGAIDDFCTHDGGDLGSGDLEGCAVECPRHGARFDLRTGAALSLPAVFPVNAYPVRVSEGRIEIDLAAGMRKLEVG